MHSFAGVSFFYIIIIFKTKTKTKTENTLTPNHMMCPCRFWVFSPFWGREVTTPSRLYFMKNFNEISDYIFLPRMSNKLQKQM